MLRNRGLQEELGSSGCDKIAFIKILYMPDSLAVAAAPSPGHTVASVPEKLFDTRDQRFTHDFFA